ncbi:MAG TPA: ATP-binding protein, partial [Rhodocyclaceae bacterium]|nr:ATP-binding protein [Rhodocyclaceae bacterium]
AALLWAVQKAEHEEQRTTLISDVLWLEQNLRFQLDTSQEKIQQAVASVGAIDDTAAKSRETFTNHAQALVKQHPEILQMLWTSPEHRVLARYPARAFPRGELEQFGESPLNDRIDIARRMGRTTYTPLYAAEGNAIHFEQLTPIPRDDGRFDTLITVYSLSKLLDDVVPWWFAEKYQLQVIDDEGATLYSRSKTNETEVVSYDLPFDAIGTRLILRVGTVRPPFNPTQRFFAAAIVVLALVVLASLWGIRRQLHGRLVAEQALRESNAFRKSMEDSLVTGLRARDLDGRLIYANPAFCQMVGFSADELIGLTAPMPYWVPDVHDETMRLHQAVMQGQAPREGYEVRLRRKSGEIFEALIYEAPLIDGLGKHIGWMGSVLDITERKRNEEFHRQQQEQLQHTARLVSLGEMASTLAHELNQPLAAISSYATGCRNKLENHQLKPDEFGEVVGKIANQAQRAGRIIRQVHDFVKKSEPRREPCSVAEVVDEAVTLFEPQARKCRIRVECIIQGGLPDVSADPTMLEQVVINLLKNASDAMIDGSEAGTAEPGRDQIQINVGGTERQIVVRVIDQGPGIPPENAEKLFAPFYTTKREGLGMGLAICRSIIEFHRGRLSLESNPEGGAIFIFTLPIEAPEAQ